MDIDRDAELAAPAAPVHVEEESPPLDGAHRRVGWSLAALFAPPTPPAGPASLALAGAAPGLTAPTLHSVWRLRREQGDRSGDRRRWRSVRPGAVVP